MQRLTILTCFLFTILTSCTTPPPARDLILTAEDMRIKRTPYHPSEVPCGEHMLRADCAK